MQRLAREPLLWFLLAGALIFVADHAWETLSERSNTIAISEGEVRSLIDKWQVQMGRAPSEEELAALIDDYVREEILYREAKRIGLDRDDTIIRRRLAQKMSFLIEDSGLDPEVSDAELVAFYEQHEGDYVEPARFSFTQIYFRSADEDRSERAQAALTGLASGADPASFGDPFMLHRSYAARSVTEIERLFGKRFAEEVAALPVDGTWRGPLESSYGLHLVLLKGREEAALPPFAAVSNRVREDYLANQRQAANERGFQELRERYRVLLPGEQSP